MAQVHASGRGKKGLEPSRNRTRRRVPQWGEGRKACLLPPGPESRLRRDTEKESCEDNRRNEQKYSWYIIKNGAQQVRNSSQIKVYRYEVDVRPGGGGI